MRGSYMLLDKENKEPFQASDIVERRLIRSKRC